MIGESMKNPWQIQSIYDLQYFICPSCDFREHSKQEFIDHVFDIHPDSTEYLMNVQDNSLEDIVFPNIKNEVKAELIVEQSSIDLEHENHDLKLCLPRSDTKKRSRKKSQKLLESEEYQQMFKRSDMKISNDEIETKKPKLMNVKFAT